MTTSQQRPGGRHAVPTADVLVDAVPVVPAQRSVPAVRDRRPQRPARTPVTVGEYAGRTRAVPTPAADVAEPRFGEWPYGRATAPAPSRLAGRGALLFGAVGLLVALLPVVTLLGGVFPAAGLPVTDLVAFPLVVVGVVLGVLGTDRAANHRGVAVVGTVLATAGLALCVLWTTLLIIAVVVSPASADSALTALSSGNAVPTG